MPFVYYICFHIIAKTFILIEISRQETKIQLHLSTITDAKLYYCPELGNDSR